MFVTPRGDLAGVLPVVISGGRPALAQRPTARMLPALAGVTADPVWLVRDDRAASYERDDWELATFPCGAAEQYAAAHWTAPEPYRAGAFLGGFTEREWACRLAEQRGYWAVLQLDDNLMRLDSFISSPVGRAVIARHGGIAMFADLLAAFTLSTNSRMTGAVLDSTKPRPSEVRAVVRCGFPYSLFVERTGPGREPWYGPTEDDILHAWQYASNATTATAALVPALRYQKEHASKTGMRAHYDQSRAAGLQRAAPEMASIQVLSRHSNGRGEPRVFHRMHPLIMKKTAPLTVTDPGLYERAYAAVERLAAEVAADFRSSRRAYWVNRARREDSPPATGGTT